MVAQKPLTKKVKNNKYMNYNSRDFYRTFRYRLSKYVSPSLCFQKENCSLVLNNQKYCQILAQYFQNLLNCQVPTSKLQFQQVPQNPNSRQPDEKEIWDTIQSLRNNKALVKMVSPQNFGRISAKNYFPESQPYFRKYGRRNKFLLLFKKLQHFTVGYK